MNNKNKSSDEAAGVVHTTGRSLDLTATNEMGISHPIDEMTGPNVIDDIKGAMGLVADVDLGLRIAGYAIRWTDGIVKYGTNDFCQFVKIPPNFQVFRTGAFAAPSFTIPTKFEGESHNLVVPVGLTIVIGGSNTGKTEMLEKVFGVHPNAEFIRFVEPETPSVSDPFRLLELIANFLVNDTQDTLFLDSLRFFVYNPGEKSAAGKGGMNMALFTSLTNLSVMAEERKKSIVAVLNPLSVDAETMKLYLEALSGSVNGVMHTTARGRFTWQARTEQSARAMKAYEIDILHPKQPEEVEKAHLRVISGTTKLLSHYLPLAARIPDDMK